jgi:hypothetical protein
VRHLQKYPQTSNWNGSPDGIWEWNERFYPSDDPFAFISLLRFPPQNDGVRLRCLKVDDAIAEKWQQTQAQLERVIGGRLRSIEFVRGCSWPCKDVPLICETTELSAICLACKASTGELDVRLRFEELPESIRVSFDGTLLATTRHADGRRSLTVTDLREKRIVAERLLDSSSLGIASIDAKPSTDAPVYSLEGFDRSGNVLLNDGSTLWRLKPPFHDVPQKAFTLAGR